MLSFRSERFFSSSHVIYPLLPAMEELFEEFKPARGASWTSSLSGAVPITAVDGRALLDFSNFIGAQ